MWRAIRYGLAGELIDLERGDVLPARLGSSGCSNGCCRSPKRSAPPTGSACPSRMRLNARSRGAEEGASLAEIYAEQVEATVGAAR